MVGSLITGGEEPTVKESELRRLGIWGTISRSGTRDESFTACGSHEFRIGVDELRRSMMKNFYMRVNRLTFLLRLCVEQVGSVSIFIGEMGVLYGVNLSRGFVYSMIAPCLVCGYHFLFLII